MNLIQLSAVCGVEIEFSFYAVTGKSEDISQHAKTPEESGGDDKTDADNGLNGTSRFIDLSRSPTSDP